MFFVRTVSDSCTAAGTFGTFTACFGRHGVAGCRVRAAGIIAVTAKCCVVTFVVGMALGPPIHFTIDY